jgi:hypothetical protein
MSIRHFTSSTPSPSQRTLRTVEVRDQIPCILPHNLYSSYRERSTMAGPPTSTAQSTKLSTSTLRELSSLRHEQRQRPVSAKMRKQSHRALVFSRHLTTGPIRLNTLQLANVSNIAVKERYSFHCMKNNYQQEQNQQNHSATRSHKSDSDRDAAFFFNHGASKSSTYRERRCQHAPHTPTGETNRVPLSKQIS